MVGGHEQDFGKTVRSDRWWVGPLLTILGLGGFIERPNTHYKRQADAPQDRQFEFVPWEWNSPLIDAVWDAIK